jgi:RTA1 like protein
MVVGFSFRANAHFDPTSLSSYLFSQVFIVPPSPLQWVSCQVLAPIFFLAANYIVFGRLLRSTLAFDSNVQSRRLSFIFPSKITAIFLSCDIASFIAQLIGAGISATTDGSTASIGFNVLLSGMCLNVASYTVFLCLVIYFDRATRKAYGSGSRNFLATLFVLYVAGTFIMVCRYPGRVTDSDPCDIQGGGICDWIDWTN